MMSGLEVAGVVLGALPLVISALEHYAEGVSTARRYFRYKAELRSLTLSVNTERSIFVNTLEQLLTGIVHVEQMDLLLSDPSGQLWRAKDSELRLQERLGSTYDTYFENVKGMDAALQAMMLKMALDANGKVRDETHPEINAKYTRPFQACTEDHTDIVHSLAIAIRASSRTSTSV